METKHNAELFSVDILINEGIFIRWMIYMLY